LPARRGADRPGVDRNRLLLVSLGGAHASDLEAWARRTFDADVVAEPFAAVAKVQDDSSHGCILLHAQRRQVRDAVQACRALRPLTRAAIVFVSDDAIRSSDRVAILEAGADDCLSGGLDFRELGLRIRQAMASGARAPAARGSEAGSTTLGEGGLVSRGYFAAEVTRRAGDAELAFFCVLAVASGALSVDEMERGLSELVRSEEGDLVAKGSDRCLVLLQGARQVQLGAFLERLRTRLRDGRDATPDVEVSVLSHPADASKIRMLVETAVAESV
jgi:DNA-binding response OmpR family regulator